MPVGAQAGGGPPRVRFAPSPTGYFHVGSARTALFNWLFARQSGGTFILRIEDTDAERNREEWVDGIVSAMAWLGMEPDEGPFRQSANAGRHAEVVDRLWDAGVLYACTCTRDEIDARTKERATPGYDGFCRERSLERGGAALRFRVPDEGSTVVHDVIRGDVEFPHSAIEDFVVVKSNGQPLFVLANVIDDIDMRITDVIRGEDLLPSTPKALMLWAAIEGDGAVLPRFAHLPMLVNEKRQKLSKRRDPVAIELYREEGYLAEAMRNYLALLGWSHGGGREILSVDELVEEFRLEDVNHSPAFFDVQKLRHVNAEYLRALPVETFVEAAAPWLRPPAAPWAEEAYDAGAFTRLAPLVQERVSTLSEVAAMVGFLFVDAPDIEDRAWETLTKDVAGTRDVLTAMASALREAPWDAAHLHDAATAVAESQGRKLGKAQAPLRIAVTGRTVGPPLFESLEVLGRDAALARVDAVLGRLGAAQE
ncbi:MAG: glutamate--tRNA ligase [Acidimicrobiales bacterium]